MEIKEGQRFKCIKTVVMDNGDVDYVKGKVYVSEHDDCITDEEGCTTHQWKGESVHASEYFLPVTDLKKHEVHVALNNDEDIIKQLQMLLEESGEKIYNHTLIGRHKGWPYAVIDNDGEWAPAGEVYVKGNNLTEVTVEELREILNKQTDNSPQVAEDKVNHPSHYTNGNIECIDAIEEATKHLTGIEAVCTANAIKYLWRWKLKNGTEDLKKAKWYIDRLLKANIPSK